MAHRPPSPALRSDEEAREPTRSRHWIDRALEYAAIHAAAPTPAARRRALRNRRGRSKGYVSLLVRLGKAFDGCTPEQVAMFRTKRLTFKIVQRVVRASMDGMEIRSALLREIAGWRPGGSRRLPTAPSPRDPDGSVFRHDAEWAARDPEGYFTAYQAFLQRLHRRVSLELRRGIDEHIAKAAVPLAGQSIRMITATMQRQGHAPPGLRSVEESIRRIRDAVGLVPPTACDESEIGE